MIALRMLQDRIVSAKAAGRPTALVGETWEFPDGSGGDFRITEIEDRQLEDAKDVILWTESIDGSIAGWLPYRFFCDWVDHGEIRKGAQG